MAARPSGAATTVSPPLSTTTVPLTLRGKARPFKLRSDFCSCVQSPEVARKFTFMRGEDRGPAAPSLSRLHKPSRMPRETRDGIGVEHDGALARQSGKHEFAGRCADADAGADRQRVEPGIGQEPRQFVRSVHRPHHDGEVCRSIDGKRFTRACDRDQSRSGAQGTACGEPRGAGRPRRTGNDHRMAAVVFVPG